MKRGIYFALEQPAQSWGFKLPFMLELTRASQMIPAHLSVNFHIILVFYLFYIFVL